MIAKTAVRRESFLDVENRKSAPLTHYDIFKKETTNLGKKLLGGFSRPPMPRRVKSSGYGSEKPRSKMFQPKINQPGRHSSSGGHKQRGGRNVTHFNDQAVDAKLPAAASAAIAKSKSGVTGGRARWEIKRDVQDNWSSKADKLRRSSSVLLMQNAVVVSERPPSRQIEAFRPWHTEGAITRLAFSSRGQAVAAAACGKAADNSIQVYNSKKRLDGDGATLLLGHRGSVRGLDFAHCLEDLLLSVGTEDRSVRLWDWKSRSVRLEVNSRSGGKSSPGDLFLPLKQHTTTHPHKEHHPRAGGDKKSQDEFFPDVITKSQFFYMDQFLLSASSNKLFVHQLGFQDDESRDLAWYSLAKSFKLSACKSISHFAAANQFFSYYALCACSDKALRVIDFNEQCVAREIYDIQARQVQKVVLPRGGNVAPPEIANLFVTATTGDGAKLWDLRYPGSGCVHRFDWPGSSGGRVFSGLDLSPCMRFLAAGSDDGSIYTFDLRSIGSYAYKLSADGCGGVITDVAFNPSGNQLLAATQLGEIVVFEH